MPRKKTEAVAMPSFEDCLERLQQVVAMLEAGSLTLEESLKLYSEGIELMRCANEHLDKAEHTIEMLTSTDGRTPFSPQEGSRSGL